MTDIQILSAATDANKVTLPESAGSYSKMTLPCKRIALTGKNAVMTSQTLSRASDSYNQRDDFTYAYDFKQITNTIKVSGNLETDWVAGKTNGKTATDYKDYIGKLRNHGGKVWLRISTENEHFAKNAGGTNRHWTYDGSDAENTAADWGLSNWDGVYAAFIMDWNFIQTSDDDIDDPSYEFVVTFLIAEQK